jgi:hypothetical protein
VALFSNWRRSEPDDEFRLDLLHDAFEAESGQMVALVGNHVSVLGDTVLHFTCHFAWASIEVEERSDYRSLPWAKYPGLGRSGRTSLVPDRDACPWFA